MVGKRINIIASPVLTSIRLHELVGQQGIVVENGPHNNGAYVQLDKAYMNELEWFIPNESIQIIE